MVHGIVERGAKEVRLVNRSFERAQKIAQEFGGPIIPVRWEDRASALAGCAMAVNATAVGNLAAAAGRGGARLIHVSTDYVFDGTKDGWYVETDPVAPLGVYGATKLAGEHAAAGIDRHLILRTAWVYGALGANFVATMLRVAATNDELRVVDDQTGGPTAAGGIAGAVLAMARALQDGAPGGTYHFAGSPDVTWAGFAREIFARAGLEVAVTGIPSSDYPTPARRPANSRLDCATLEADFGIPRPDWRESLGGILAELAAT